MLSLTLASSVSHHSLYSQHPLSSSFSVHQLGLQSLGVTDKQEEKEKKRKKKPKKRPLVLATGRQGAPSPLPACLLPCRNLCRLPLINQNKRILPVKKECTEYLRVCECECASLPSLSLSLCVRMCQLSLFPGNFLFGSSPARPCHTESSAGTRVGLQKRQRCTL